MLLAKQPLSAVRVSQTKKPKQIIPFCSAAATSAHGDDGDPFHPIDGENSQTIHFHSFPTTTSQHSSQAFLFLLNQARASILDESSAPSRTVSRALSSSSMICAAAPALSLSRREL